MPAKIPEEGRADHFWSKVNKNGPVPAHRPELGSCWEWTGYKRVNGYGIYSVRRIPTYAHRFSWELTHGSIGTSDVLHKCDNPPCVRPDHLFTGTARDNMLDALSKHRVPVGEQRNQAKFTNAQVAAIRAFADSRKGLTPTERHLLAIIAGMSKSHLDQILGDHVRRHEQ